MKTIKTIYHKGHTINLIENDYFNIIESEDDNILVSNGFMCAINDGKLPTNETTSEYHHIFVKDAEYGYKAKEINFK